eukprot:861081-Pelagomonas_calceolata.AAC.1
MDNSIQKRLLRFLRFMLGVRTSTPSTGEPPTFLLGVSFEHLRDKLIELQGAYPTSLTFSLFAPAPLAAKALISSLS